VIESPRGQVMRSYLPGLYAEGGTLDDLLESLGAEFDLVREAVTDTLNQFYVRTATWGLDLWEDELQLTANPSLTTDQRRDRIVAKLQGTGTPTIALVEQIVAIFHGGVAYAIQDEASYSVIIKFISLLGVLATLPDVQQAIREVLPAHLDVTWDFNWFLWSQLDAEGWRWSDLDALGLTWPRLEQFA
jgi:hypothetical protein